VLCGPALGVSLAGEVRSFAWRSSLLPAFLLSLREGLEIALLIGIILGSLRRVQRPELKQYVWLGAGSATALSLVIALILYALGASLQGQAEQIFEGLMMLLAAGVLTWMIFWMQRQSRMITMQLEAGVRQATLQSGGRALFFVAFFAVVREGIELALFLTASAMTTDGLQTIVGALLGLAGAAILGWGLYASTLRLNVRSFFAVTSILLLFFAAGLVAHGVHELNEAGWIPPIVEHVWDINPILDESSGVGMLLKTLFGYNGNPSLTEVLAYIAYFVLVLIGLKLAAFPARPSPKAIS